MPHLERIPTAEQYAYFCKMLCYPIDAYTYAPELKEKLDYAFAVTFEK